MRLKLSLQIPKNCPENCNENKKKFDFSLKNCQKNNATDSAKICQNKTKDKDKIRGKKNNKYEMHLKRHFN
jgi:hypothetical protein